MAGLVSDDPHLHADLIIPIPLHPRRLRERGFNQAELLAREVARAAIGRVDTTLLMKVRETRSQAELSRQERAINLTGAFEASRPVNEARVLLVDDVMSTGATANECARVLRRAGAGEVAVVVAAMALPERARK